MDREPDARAAWKEFHRNRRARMQLHRDGKVLIAVLFAGLMFWVGAAAFLSLVL